MYNFRVDREDQLKKNFKYRLIGSKLVKRIVLETLLFLPPEISGYVSRHCWFISSFEDGWAFVLKGGEIKRDEYIIFLSDELLGEDEEQIRYTILHEIGHVVLGHRNSIGKIQRKSEVNRQEKEAHSFVVKYYKNNGRN